MARRVVSAGHVATGAGPHDQALGGDWWRGPGRPVGSLDAVIVASGRLNNSGRCGSGPTRVEQSGGPGQVFGRASAQSRHMANCKAEMAGAQLDGALARGLDPARLDQVP